MKTIQILSRSFLSLVIIVMIMNIAQGQERLILDKIVAKVGSELILLSDVEEQFSYIKDRQGQAGDIEKCQVVHSLLAQNLLVTQARLDSIEISEDEVESQMNARIDQTLGYMNGDISLFEEYYGQTINQVKEQFRRDLRNQIMGERMRQQILGDINVTPSEVRKFFEQIPRDSLPYFNSEVEIGEIVYYPVVNEEEDRIAREKAEKLRVRIVDGGENFEELAKIYSDDIGSGRQGGDLGRQSRGTFVTEFEAVVYNLEKDEISTPVKTEFGYHIIQLIERRGNSVHARHILITPKKTEADFDLAQDKLAAVKKDIDTDSIKFEYAVRKYSDKNQQSYNNGGRMINNKTGNNFFEANNLDPEIFFAIDTMQIGQISSPVLFKDQRDQAYYRLIKLLSRTDPHQADLSQDYSRIRTAAVESKKGIYFEQWMLDKAKSSYVYVDPMFGTCPNLDAWNIDYADGQP